MRRTRMRSNIQKITALALSLAAILLLTSCKTEEPQPLPSPTPFVPNIDAFTVGTIDDTGYASVFFGFGFRLPEGWQYYSRSETDKLNQIQADPADQQAYAKENVDQLKNAEGHIEYFAGNDQKGENLTIYAVDYARYPDEILMEMSEMDKSLGWLADLNGDSKDDIEHLSLDVVDLFGVEHPVYRYDIHLEGYGNRGAFLTIKQGTTFAVILINGADENAVNAILQGFYALNNAS